MRNKVFPKMKESSSFVNSLIILKKFRHFVVTMKIMTAISVIEKVNINKKIVIGDEVLKSYGSGIYVKKGEKLKIKDLTEYDSKIMKTFNVNGPTLKINKLLS